MPFLPVENELVDVGVLEARQAGREVLFRHPKLLHVLTSEKSDFDGS